MEWSFGSLPHSACARAVAFVCLLLPLLLVQIGCATQTSGNALAARFNQAIQGLETQQRETVSVIQQATEAQDAIVLQTEYRFEQQETIDFIQKWEQANLQVNRLRQSLAELNQSYRPMLQQLRLRAEAINDPYIRQETIAYLADTEQAYEVQAQEAARCIEELEATIRLGNDIVEALRIIGSARFIRIKMEELKRVCEDSMEGLEQVNRLVNQGRDLLDVELRAARAA